MVASNEGCKDRMVFIVTVLTLTISVHPFIVNASESQGN